MHGHVQGVGFRWSTRAQALRLGLTGGASNLPDGTVRVHAQGRREDCQRLLDWLATEGPGRVDHVVVEWGDPRPSRGFRIG